MTLVRVESVEEVYEVNENASKDDVKRAEPLFFDRPFGKRERIIMYRGFLIVRNTVQRIYCDPERKTVVYIFGKPTSSKGFYTLLVFEPNSIRQAKRLIDRALETHVI